MRGTSLAHENAQLCQLKNGINADSSRIFSRKLSERPEGRMTRVICKEQGKWLDECLIKRPPGKNINGITHLRTHKQLSDAQGKTEAEAIKRKTRGNDND